MQVGVCITAFSWTMTAGKGKRRCTDYLNNVLNFQNISHSLPILSNLPLAILKRCYQKSAPIPYTILFSRPYIGSMQSSHSILIPVTTNLAFWLYVVTNQQTGRLMVGNDRCPSTSASPKRSQVTSHERHPMSFLTPDNMCTISHDDIIFYKDVKE